MKTCSGLAPISHSHETRSYTSFIKSDTDGKEADRMNEREMMICGEDDYRDVQGEKSSL
jgi:hypothetical protein